MEISNTTFTCRCGKNIGTDYMISWAPGHGDFVCEECFNDEKAKGSKTLEQITEKAVSRAVRAERLRIAEELYSDSKKISFGNHIRDWPTIEYNKGRKSELLQHANDLALLSLYGGPI